MATWFIRVRGRWSLPAAAVAASLSIAPAVLAAGDGGEGKYLETVAGLLRVFWAP